MTNALFCSPNKKNHKKNTCFNNNELLAIAKAYNSFIKKQSKICNLDTKTCSKDTHEIDLNSKDLYLEISKKLNVLCDKEYCWTDLDFINKISDKKLHDSILHFTFKPKGLPTLKTWFSSNNINEIIKQYEIIHSEFKFLGAQPSDFSRIIKLNYNKLQKIKYLGIIFNTDDHTKPGTHWLAVFIDNNNKTIEYFDSLGHPPIKNICNFLKHFHNYNFKINRTPFQKGNNNCGVFACYYIIQRLLGYSYKEIKSQMLTDKMMTNYRQLLFRPLIKPY